LPPAAGAQAQKPEEPAKSAPAAGQAPAQAPGKIAPADAARRQYRAAPVTNVTVDGNEAMFTTMCALLAAGFESNVSAENWSPMRSQLRERMQQQQGPAVDALRGLKFHELTLTVTSVNHSAVQLYEKLAFKTLKSFTAGVWPR